MAVLYDGVVDVDYSQYYVTDPGDAEFEMSLEAAFQGQLNTLCGASYPGSLFLCAGRHRGGIELRVELLGAEPDIIEECGEIVECGFRVRSADLHLYQMFDGRSLRSRSR